VINERLSGVPLWYYTLAREKVNDLSATARHGGLLDSAAPPNWVDRNWKWLVALLLVLALLIVVSFIAVVLFGVEALKKNSDPYQLAARRATESPAVAEKLGTPIHVGWFVSGNINFSGSDGSVNLSIPVSGPNGRGHIGVVGKEHAKRWTFRNT
jgi:hypothetical protein